MSGIAEAARTAMERLSRGRSLWRRMPAEFGRYPIRVTPDAALRWLKPGRAAFDELLLDFSRRHVRPRDVVWDIGANVGVFALAAASQSARVLAIEPDPWLHALLASTASHSANRALGLQTLCAAVSDQPGAALLAIARRGRASNFLEAALGRNDAGGVRITRLVPVVTLDALLVSLPPPTTVKIDVEGAEVAVLDGSARLLSEARPTMLIEVDARTRASVITSLCDARYEIFDYSTGKPCRADGQASNLLARPT